MILMNMQTIFSILLTGKTQCLTEMQILYYHFFSYIFNEKYIEQNKIDSWWEMYECTE